MLSLNSHQLNVFLAAAESLNFTQAAQQLQITQPSVSQHIQTLEDHFGIPLFMRNGRNIELTDAGSALVPLAREMVYIAKQIEETMASLHGDVFGHLVVGCSTATGRYLLPKLLAVFHTQYSQVRATCKVVSQAHALQMLQDGTAHLALASNPPFTPDIEFHFIGNENIVLICHPQHPWAERGEISISELLQADFILPDENSDTYASIRAALAKAEYSVHQLNTIVSLGSLEAIALSVQEGLGVGFVPELMVRRLVQDHACLVEVKGLDIHRQVFVARSTRRSPSIAQNAFWELVIDPDNPILKPIHNQLSENDSSHTHQM